VKSAFEFQYLPAHILSQIFLPVPVIDQSPQRCVTAKESSSTQSHSGTGGRKKCSGFLDFFKLNTIILGAAKPRMQQWCPVVDGL